MLELQELLTKKRIEKLSDAYAGDELTRGDVPKDGKYDVFISHSSHDMAFVRKLILFLKNSKGVENAYVDWLDPAMNHVTDAQTAVDLKWRIKDARKVIYVVTTESLKSAWCSWEIGFSDCAKGVNDVAILAVKSNNGRWTKREFLQQYPWIYYDQKEHQFMVSRRDDKRVKLYEWLREAKNGDRDA